MQISFYNRGIRGQTKRAFPSFTRLRCIPGRGISDTKRIPRFCGVRIDLERFLQRCDRILVTAADALDNTQKEPRAEKGRLLLQRNVQVVPCVFRKARLHECFCQRHPVRSPLGMQLHRSAVLRDRIVTAMGSAQMQPVHAESTRKLRI